VAGQKHGSRTRRSWRKLHIGVDADTGRILASSLTASGVDGASQAGPLLDQDADPIASFTADGAYDQDGVYSEVATRYPGAAVIVPPRSSAMPSAMAETAPTGRDQHLRTIAERGRMGWLKASGYNWRALVEADIALQAGHWRRTALTHGRTPRGGGGYRRQRAEPHARARTAGACPARMTADPPTASCSFKLVHATQSSKSTCQRT
jgi:hypothetical protein